MTHKKTHTDFQPELDDDDKAFITEIFFEQMVTKLLKANARIGTLNCDFAGNQYKHWNIHFKSKGPGFEIVDFEYDSDSCGFSLNP
jgi:hypothetical protein